jgi:hypothetical protein
MAERQGRRPDQRHDRWHGVIRQGIRLPLFEWSAEDARQARFTTRSVELVLGFGVYRLGVTKDTRPATNRWLRILEHRFDASLVVEPATGGSVPPAEPDNRGGLVKFNEAKRRPVSSLIAARRFLQSGGQYGLIGGREGSGSPAQ